ncbi:MAG: FAD-dependent oxidoreductase [Acidobacteriota bacterium]
MSRIAVVGAGISGLAAAWLLSRRHDVLLLEREARIGGHTHTHHLDTPDGPLALDTGFLVHNTRTYPLLVRLFDELGVERLDSDMSFGVTNPRTGFEYSTRSLNGLFADRRNLIRPAHYALLLEILRFNREARRLAAGADAGGAAGVDVAATADLTLGEFLERHHFGEAFTGRYLFPLAAAIWSASPGTIRAFPALTLVRFFQQHGMITVLDHPTWKIVKGGSAAYIPKLLAAPRVTTWTGAAPTAVRRQATKVELSFADRPPVDVDGAVMASFKTTANEAVLHTDATFLPKRPAARASWNYLLGESSGAATVTYHLNRLQRLVGRPRANGGASVGPGAGPLRKDYCVTLNPVAPVAPYEVIKRMTYTHPLYTVDAIRAQRRWAEISGRNRVHFCGAYWFYGFHEDGLRSAVRVAASLGVTW